MQTYYICFIMQHKKILFIFFLNFFQFFFAQESKDISNSLYGLDINFGYNISRGETNYFFEEKMPFSFQIYKQRANYFETDRLGKYGYSDFGFTFLYHDFRSPELGKNYGLYAFMEYYLIKPSNGFQLSLRVSQGVAYNTNPYDRNTNPKNLYFGFHWLFPFDLALYLKSPKIKDKWRTQLGFAVFHYSNGNLQSPNYGANIPSLTIGVVYDSRNMSAVKQKVYPDYEKDWQYYTFLRFGVNESDYIDSGIYPFFIPGFQAGKHLNYRHKIYVGIEMYFSYFLRELIRYEYYSFPEQSYDKISDFKRLGMYVGHEFYYDKFGIEVAMGYYLYYPYNFETRYYNRVGTKYRINKNITALCSLKAHSFSRAEALEFGLMYRFK